MTSEILLTALVTWLALLVEHWFPWRLLLRRDLPRIAAYTMGVLALILPLSVLYWRWSLAGLADQRGYLIALWAVTLAGGAAVAGAYVVDWLLGRLALAIELQELLGLRDGESD